MSKFTLEYWIDNNDKKIDLLLNTLVDIGNESNKLPFSLYKFSLRNIVDYELKEQIKYEKEKIKYKDTDLMVFCSKRVSQLESQLSNIHNNTVFSLSDCDYKINTINTIKKLLKGNSNYILEDYEPEIIKKRREKLNKLIKKIKI